MYRLVAQNSALAECKAKQTCDLEPFISSVTTERNWVLVSVQFNIDGHTALYKYNCTNGSIQLIDILK